MPTISSSRVQPLVTPSTALLTSARASPWTAACESFSRIATRLLSCCSTRMPAGSGVSSLPFGPATATVLPSIFTVTPLGRGIGFFPILDIAVSSQLPDFAEDLAAHAFFAGLATGHHASRRGQNVDAQSPEHARNLRPPHVNPAAGAGNPLHFRDRGFIVAAVLQIDAHDLVSVFFRCLEVRDVALFLQNAGNLQLQLGSGNIYLLVTRINRIANARQHVCDRIGQPHRLLLLEPPVRSAPSGEPAAACFAALNPCRPPPDPSCLAKDPGAPRELLASCERQTARLPHLPTRTTSKPRESLPATPARGNTDGRCKTSAGKRAAARRSCSGCACAKRTWACLRPSLVLLW